MKEERKMDNEKLTMPVHTPGAPNVDGRTPFFIIHFSLFILGVVGWT
jgi:hypothetical protein